MKQILRINLTNNPVTKTDKKGREYVTFGGAKDIMKKNTDGSFEKTGTEFYNVTAYEPAKEFAAELKKGDRVELMGFDNEVERNGKTVHFFSMKNGKMLFRKEEKEAA